MTRITKFNKILNKMDRRDIYFISKQLKIKTAKNESKDRMINKLLLPLRLNENKKYRMDVQPENPANILKRGNEVRMSREYRKSCTKNADCGEGKYCNLFNECYPIREEKEEKKDDTFIAPSSEKLFNENWLNETDDEEITDPLSSPTEFLQTDKPKTKLWIDRQEEIQRELNYNNKWSDKEEEGKQRYLESLKRRDGIQENMNKTQVEDAIKNMSIGKECTTDENCFGNLECNYLEIPAKCRKKKKKKEKKQGEKRDYNDRDAFPIRMPGITEEEKDSDEYIEDEDLKRALDMSREELTEIDVIEEKVKELFKNPLDIPREELTETDVIEEETFDFSNFKFSDTEYVNKKSWLYNRLYDLINSSKNIDEILSFKGDIPNDNFKTHIDTYRPKKTSKGVKVVGLVSKLNTRLHSNVNIFLWGLLKFFNYTNIYSDIIPSILTDFYETYKDNYFQIEIKRSSKWFTSTITTIDEKKFRIGSKYTGGIDYLKNGFFEEINRLYEKSLRKSKNQNELFTENFFKFDKNLTDILKKNYYSTLKDDFIDFVKYQQNLSGNIDNQDENIEVQIDLEKSIFQGMVEKIRYDYWESYVSFEYKKYELELKKLKAFKERIKQKDENLIKNIRKELQKYTVTYNDKFATEIFDKIYSNFQISKEDEKEIKIIKMGHQIILDSTLYEISEFIKKIQKYCEEITDKNSLIYASNCIKIDDSNVISSMIKYKGKYIYIKDILSTEPIDTSEKASTVVGLMYIDMLILKNEFEKLKTKIINVYIGNQPQMIYLNQKEKQRQQRSSNNIWFGTNKNSVFGN